MILENETAAPKHILQLRHLKFREEQKDKTYAGNNIADEIANLDPILETHELCRRLKSRKDQLDRSQQLFCTAKIR